MNRPTRYIPAHVRRQLHFYAGKQCPQCGVTLQEQDLLFKPTIDHIVAVARGGGNDLFNLQVLCLRCNVQKSTRLEGRDLEYALSVERRHQEIAAYFHGGQARIEKNPRLRRPQVDAYRALRGHFRGAQAAIPAVIEIPTGSGKTGIIAIAPFDVARGRVLVLTPNLTIREGIEIALGATTPAHLHRNFYLQTEVFKTLDQLPRLVALRRGIINKDDLLQADLVVANVQQMNTWLQRSPYCFPASFFDMVIVDEAHHAPAPTWRYIERAFPQAKKLYLTATPFRSDNQPIRGTLVYRYRLSQAIANAYVKNIQVITPDIEKLTFVIRGRGDEVTLDDILRIREEDWFSKDIALSTLCNRNIIDKAYAVLMDLRQRTRFNHQMIAVACSRRHARELVQLFEGKGLRATYVESIDMPFEERERRLRAYEGGLYDVVVHVGILGEGYDHKAISVAVIFRPFRSAPPYIQFVGRALRHIPELPREANCAYVVQHPGLNIDRWWLYFKTESDEARQLIAAAEAPAPEPHREGPSQDEAPAITPEPYTPQGTVVQEVIRGWTHDPYLSLSAEQAEQVRRLQSELESILQTPLRISPRAADAPTPQNRPDRERHEWRKTLHQQVQRAAGDLCLRLGVSLQANNLVARLDKPDAQSNYQAIIRVINNRLNARMGYGEKNNRVEWAQDAIVRATHEIMEVCEALYQELRPHVPPPSLFDQRIRPVRDVLDRPTEKKNMAGE